MKTIFQRKKELEEKLEKQEKIIKTLRNSRTELLKENSEILRENYSLRIKLDEEQAKKEDLRELLERNPYNNHEAVVRKALEFINDNSKFSEKKIKELA